MLEETFYHQDNPFTIDDITLIPSLGRINSRTEIKLFPFLYSAPMDKVTGYDLALAMLSCNQMPVLSRFLSNEERIQALESLHNNPLFFYAIGLSNLEEEITLIKKIIGKNKVNLALDIAHGHSLPALQAGTFLKAEGFTTIMSGSICTPVAALDVIKHGFTHLRVGIGNGSACTTRLMTGIGLPNAYAVYSIKQAILNRSLSATIVADGGIKYPGDVVKYMVLGADGVMLGRIFSKAQESAGWESYIVHDQIVQGKRYRGQASKEFQEDMGRPLRAPEGVSFPYEDWDGKTTVRSIIELYEDGMRSACSYLGIYSNSKMYDPSAFIRISNTSIQEAQPHGFTLNWNPNE